MTTQNLQHCLLGTSTPQLVHRHGRGPALVIAGLLSLLAAAQPVHAESRMIEFQLKKEKLVELVRNRLKQESETLCVGQLDLFGWPVVLDHMEFPEGGALRRETESTPWPPYDPNSPFISAGPYDIHRVQLTVPVTLFVKSEDCVQDPACGRDEWAIPPATVDMVFTLFARGSALCVVFEGLESEGSPLDIGVQLGNLEASFCRTLNLGSIRQLVGEGSRVTNTGLSADTGFSRIAFRIELDGQKWDNSPPDDDETPPDPSWVSFFSGLIGPGLDHMPERDWSVFADHELFTAKVVRQFDASLKESHKFELEEPPGVSGQWTPLGEGGGNVTIGFSGEVDINTDLCFLESIGVDPVTVSMDYTVDSTASDEMQTHATLETDLVDSDVLACSGLLGFQPPALVSLGIIASTIQPGEGDLNLPGECTTLSGTEFACSLPMQLPPVSVGTGFGLSGELTLDKMVGMAAGPILGGSCAVDLRQVSRMNFTSDGFDYGVHGGCYGAPNGTGEWPWIGYRNFSDVSGRGILCHDIEIIDDPLNLFTVVGAPKAGERLSDCCPNKPSTFGIKFPRSSASPAAVAQYFDPNSEHFRYPCRVLVRSSEGSRSFEIEAPIEGDRQRHMTELLIKQADCIPPAEVPILGWDVMWTIDPSPVDIVFRPVVEDPTDEITAVSAELIDLHMTVNDPIGADAYDKGDYKFSAVSVSAHGSAALDPCLIRPCGGGVAGARGANGNTDNATADRLEIPFSADVIVDLSALVLDDAASMMVVMNDPVTFDAEIPAAELPRGVETMRVRFSLQPGQLTLVGVPPLEPEPAEGLPGCNGPACEHDTTGPGAPDVPLLALEPAGGLCGAGLGFYGPLTLATMFAGLRRRPCRHRRRQRMLR